MNLKDIQDHPEKIMGLGITTLAELAHSSEDEEDEVTFFAVMREVEDTKLLDVFRLEYMRLMRARMAK